LERVKFAPLQALTPKAFQSVPTLERASVVKNPSTTVPNLERPRPAGPETAAEHHRWSRLADAHKHAAPARRPPLEDVIPSTLHLTLDLFYGRAYTEGEEDEFSIGEVPTVTLTNAQRQARFRERRAHLQASDVLLRACTARAIACHRGDFTTADEVAAEAWPLAHEVAVFSRAAFSPTTMASSPDLVQNAVGDFIANIGPASAGAQLLSRGMQLKFDGYGAITAPAILPASTDVGFVAEGAPIPVRQMLFGGFTLVPTKLKTICVFNREVFEHATLSP
jgi:hypothetical protein